MSFSSQIKSEILDNKPLRQRFRLELAYGFFLFAGSFTPDEIAYVTESQDLQKLFYREARWILGKDALIRTGEIRRSGRVAWSASIPDAASRNRLLLHFGHTGIINHGLLETPEQVGAFLAGAFLSCGSTSDPEKSYHLEFVTRRRELATGLSHVLEAAIPGCKSTTRRTSHIVYYKDCSQIEDLLTLIGASRASLAMIDVEMIKQVRNQANRVTNCETANIDKTVGAAATQISDIEYILRTKGEEYLPESLREVARLRMENPDLSLRELAELMPEPISRSGMHHRLEKISRLAEELRRG
ncbi:DNA-binding protein WhiA [Ruminococcaceae bacterium OttesenSCG-928-L11]|nr:DNA-binding protein WhiA [Ruminococcaceae bacterium OttesenSCG-928-L11]